MSNNVILLGFGFLIFGCMNSVVALQPAGKRVVVVRETTKPSHCKVLGKIQGSSHASDDKEARKGAENDFRNRAAELEANYAVIESQRSGLRGTTSQRQVVIGGKALFCQTVEMDEAEAKEREQALKRKEEQAIQAQQEKERKELEAKEAKERKELEAKEAKAP